MNAGIPFVLKGDAPNASPIGNMMKFAQDEHATRLGQIGRKSGTGLFPLNEEFTDKWRTGDVGPLELLNTLNGGTLTIDNTEVRRHIHLALYIRMYVLFLHARIVNRCKLKIGPTAGGIVFLCISRVHSFPKPGNRGVTGGLSLFFALALHTGQRKEGQGEFHHNEERRRD